MRTLQQLLENLKANPQSYRWDSLPNFGGREPDQTQEVWSWDHTHLLVGTCSSDIRIEPRASSLYSALTTLLGPMDDGLTILQVLFDEILDLIDYDKLLRMTVKSADFYASEVQVWIDEEEVYLHYGSASEYRSNTDGLIGCINTTGGDNSFLWEGYASYDDDGRLVIDESGEVIDDVSSFIDECMDHLDKAAIFQDFRDQLRDQLFRRFRQ